MIKHVLLSIYLISVNVFHYKDITMIMYYQVHNTNQVLLNRSLVLLMNIITSPPGRNGEDRESDIFIPECRANRVFVFLELISSVQDLVHPTGALSGNDPSLVVQ